MVGYHKICNHCGVAYKSLGDYLSHCRAQALAMGHGTEGTVCPDIRTCSWVNLNVAQYEYLDAV